MKNRKEKKNDKLIIFIICFLAFALLSWIIGASTYQGGKLAEIGMYRAGLYDLVAIIISGITYKIEDILYMEQEFIQLKFGQRIMLITYLNT